MMPVTSGTLDSPAVAVLIAPWNSADFASAPGVADRKSAMTELLPAPNSRVEPGGDRGRFGIGVEPTAGREGR